MDFLKENELERLFNSFLKNDNISEDKIHDIKRIYIILFGKQK